MGQWFAASYFTIRAWRPETPPWVWRQPQPLCTRSYPQRHHGFTHRDAASCGHRGCKQRQQTAWRACPATAHAELPAAALSPSIPPRRWRPSEPPKSLRLGAPCDQQWSRRRKLAQRLCSGTHAELPAAARLRLDTWLPSTARGARRSSQIKQMFI